VLLPFGPITNHKVRGSSQPVATVTVWGRKGAINLAYKYIITLSRGHRTSTYTYTNIHCTCMCICTYMYTAAEAKPTYSRVKAKTNKKYTWAWTCSDSQKGIWNDGWGMGGWWGIPGRGPHVERRPIKSSSWYCCFTLLFKRVRRRVGRTTDCSICSIRKIEKQESEYERIALS